MEQPQKFDLMQEIARIFLDALRRQAFSVVLLLMVCGGLSYALVETRNECREHTKSAQAEYAATLKTLQDEIRACVKDRESLSVEVATLRERINLLLPIKRR